MSPDLSILRAVRVSDSHRHLLGDCNNIALTTLTIEIQTQSDCSLDPIFQLSTRHRESFTAIGRHVDIYLQQTD
jgi:hypothetical protein